MKNGSTPEIQADSNFESVHYRISYYKRSLDRLAIVFSSAGKWGAGEPIEEFKNTILKTGVSAIFVICKGIEWYNNDETPDLIEMLCETAQNYPHCCTLGESMGGSGALMLAKYSRNISRVLGFSPQFSIKPPFVDFDIRYREIGNSITRHLHADFADESVNYKSVLVYGSKDFYDYVHIAMFRAHGFHVIRVVDSDHGVARHLKNLPSGNLLLPLVALVCDFTLPFSPQSVTALLRPVVDSPAPPHMLADPGERFGQRNLPPADGRKNIALGKTASQSSTTLWSFPPNTDTASNAVAPLFSPDFSFHTDFEFEPWWQVDLDGIYPLQEIQIYNRRSNPERFLRFTISFSLDGAGWQEVHKKADDTLIAGDRNPFIWKPDSRIEAGFVRITLIGEGILHLSRIKIFASGEKIPIRPKPTIQKKTGLGKLFHRR